MASAAGVVAGLVAGVLLGTGLRSAIDERRIGSTMLRYCMIVSPIGFGIVISLWMRPVGPLDAFMAGAAGCFAGSVLVATRQQRVRKDHHPRTHD